MTLAPTADVDESVALPSNTIYVGRLRRQRQDPTGGTWGFIFHELHNCDIFLDASNISESSAPLKQGDFVLYEVGKDENGTVEARNGRKAEPHEVDAQQELLAPAYARQQARAPQVPELPRSTFSEASDRMVQGQTLSTTVPGQNRDHMQQQGGYAGGRPPPPPPMQPAPTAQGAYGSGNHMLQQQQHQPQQFIAQQNTYANATTYTGGGSMDRGGQSWSGSVEAPAVLGTNPSQPTNNSRAPTAVRLLLEPPPLLDRFDAKAVVAALKSGGGQGRRRPAVFGCSRTGAAAQIGHEWCEILRASEAAGQLMEQEDGHQMQQAQQQVRGVVGHHHGNPTSGAGMAGWADHQQMQQQPWLWGSTASNGQLALDMYGQASPMTAGSGVVGPHGMMGMADGGGGLYATSSAG